MDASAPEPRGMKRPAWSQSIRHLRVGSGACQFSSRHPQTLPALLGRRENPSTGVMTARGLTLPSSRLADELGMPPFLRDGAQEREKVLRVE